MFNFFFWTEGATISRFCNFRRRPEARRKQSKGYCGVKSPIRHASAARRSRVSQLLWQVYTKIVSRGCSFKQIAEERRCLEMDWRTRICLEEDQGTAGFVRSFVFLRPWPSIEVVMRRVVIWIGCSFGPRFSRRNGTPDCLCIKILVSSRKKLLSTGQRSSFNYFRRETVPFLHLRTKIHTGDWSSTSSLHFGSKVWNTTNRSSPTTTVGNYFGSLLLRSRVLSDWWAWQRGYVITLSNEE